MKTLSSFLIIFIFIFTILTLNSPPSSASDDCDKFVCDRFGEHAKSNKPYRIGPPLKSIEEGYLSIKLASTVDTRPCPLKGIVVKETGYVGDYFKITPIVPTDDGRLPLETPFSISAVEKSGPCNKTDGYLRTTQRNKRVKFWHVTGNGRFNTPSSCFQFVIKSPLQEEEDVLSYVLQNCPGKCGRSRTKECFGVGNRTEGGYNYLTTGLGLAYELVLRGKEDSGDYYDA